MIIYLHFLLTFAAYFFSKGISKFFFGVNTVSFWYNLHVYSCRIVPLCFKSVLYLEDDVNDPFTSASVQSHSLHRWLLHNLRKKHISLLFISRIFHSKYLISRFEFGIIIYSDFKSFIFFAIFNAIIYIWKIKKSVYVQYNIIFF